MRTDIRKLIELYRFELASHLAERLELADLANASRYNLAKGSTALAWTDAAEYDLLLEEFEKALARRRAAHEYLLLGQPFEWWKREEEGSL